MVRAIALWGAELGWRGQRDWEREFEQLQYQALMRCTGATRGSRKELVSQIAGVESPSMAMDAAQSRLMGKILKDPTALGDLLKSKEAGVPTALTRIIKTATGLAEGTTKLSFGEACMQSKIPEADLKLSSEDFKGNWQQRILELGEDSMVIFMDGSKLEGGGVGASWWNQEKRKGYGIGLGKIATVWDGEVAGLRGALTCTPETKKIIILSDLQAAITTTKQAGRTGKARTRHLR